MKISVQKSNQLKSIAILMMLFLHLFNRDYHGVFKPLIFFGSQPLSYYISLFCDACLPIFAFVTGYGLFYKYRQNSSIYNKLNFIRLKKLYINFWIILVIFAVILGTILQVNGYPGSMVKFILNFTAVNPTYNGAWWFLTIYILFVLTSSFWFFLLNRINPYAYFAILLLIYIPAFYIRIYVPLNFDDVFLNWFQQYSALYFCTLFQFMAGGFALKYDWHRKFSAVFSKMPQRNWLSLLLISLLIVLHGIIPNFFVAPFTALGFIFLFLQLDFSPVLNVVLDFFTPHATNIWLVHMFFYLIFFSDLVYSFTYVLPIFVVLLLLSLLSSYVINLFNKPIQKWL